MIAHDEPTQQGYIFPAGMVCPSFCKDKKMRTMLNVGGTYLKSLLEGAFYSFMAGAGIASAFVGWLYIFVYVD